jgi:hypothetical protein
MTDTTELVARLRDQQDMIQLGEDAYEAADAIERLIRERDEARALLCKWDALIKHQYTGSREAMSDMARVAQETVAALKEPTHD